MNFIKVLLAILGLSDFALARITTQSILAQLQGDAGPYKINALLVSDTEFSNPPLVVFTHGGTPDLQKSNENHIFPTLPFVEMGFAVLLVERRGFGHSKEKFIEIPDEQTCEKRDHFYRGRVTSEDVLGTLKFALENGWVKTESVILSGFSVGGFASIYMSSLEDPLIGKLVKGSVAFSPGAGSNYASADPALPAHCNRQGMKDVMTSAGSKSKVPMLWMYAENDKLFPQDWRDEMFFAYQGAGGQAELTLFPPVLDDGHKLFKQAAPVWIPRVKEFLKKKIGLCPRCS